MNMDKEDFDSSINVSDVTVIGKAKKVIKMKGNQKTSKNPKNRVK